MNGAGVVALAYNIDTTRRAGNYWLTGDPIRATDFGGVSEILVADGDLGSGAPARLQRRRSPPSRMGRQHRLGHRRVLAGGIGMFSREEDNIVWGTLALDEDNIVWGTNVPLSTVLTWAGTAGLEDNIVWGTSAWAQNIVWGTSLVGFYDGQNIVWGTVRTMKTTSCGAPWTRTTSSGAPPRARTTSSGAPRKFPPLAWRGGRCDSHNTASRRDAGPDP